MAADDKTTTGRDLDKALDHAVASLEVRHEKRVRNQLLSSPEEEDTGVIESEALQRVKASSDAPPKDSIARQLVYVLNALPPWSRPFIVALLVVLLAGSGWSLASLTGMVK